LCPRPLTLGRPPRGCGARSNSARL
jgi:hypothetical protein